MNLGALFSGGKDSTYSIFLAKKDGHQIKCMVSIFPLSEESTLLHFPNMKLTKLQAKTMQIPQIHLTTDSVDSKKEIDSIKGVLKKAKEDYKIEGLVQGGIISQYQKNHFESVCSELDLKLVSPVWKKNPKEYMKALIDDGFHFIIVSVSSDGLDDSWLGKEINQNNLEQLENLSEKFGFNLNFEGGEAETLVVDCPLFSNPLKIKKAHKIWDGYRGRFEIEEAELDYNAR